jgi:hypothetical protein
MHGRGPIGSPRVIAPEVMDLARARGDLGIERAARKAERTTPEWVAKAADLLRIAAVIEQARGPLFAEFTVEQLRLMVDKALPKPTDERAWGAATRAARAAGFIEPIDGKFRPAASSNGSPKQVYRKGPNA